MITTRQINVRLAKGKKELSRVTTKDVDASIRVEVPTGKAKKKPIVSTNKLADVTNIAEKKRRDDIMAERKKLDLKDEKKIVMAKKKPWKDMTDEEKKIIQRERMAKAREAKKDKKK